MSKVQQRSRQLIPSKEAREAQRADIAKTQGEVSQEVQKPGVGQLPISDQAIDGDRAKDFVAAETGQKTGASVMDVRTGAATQTLDDFVATQDWSEIYPAKDLMNDQEISSFLRGEMSVDDFKGFLEQARGPMAKDQLRHFYPTLDETYDLMTQDEKTKIDAGQMSPIELNGIQGEQWERQAAAAEAAEADGIYDVGNRPDLDPGKLDQPEAKKLYKPTDIMNRIKNGNGHNVMFAGQLMDRAVLRTMFNSIQGQGDGRISRADVHKFLPQILDAGKITTAEENAILFGLKYCRFTKAADRELTKAIADKFPNSAIAKFGSLGQPPRFADYQQYDLPMFAGRSADLYGAKGVMSSDEMARWSDGNMSLAEFNNVLKRANQPAHPEDLRDMFGGWTAGEAVDAMTDAEYRRFDAGKMCPAEFQNIQYRSWEEANPSLKGKTPYQEDYKPGFKPFVADDVQNPKVRTLNQQLAKLNDRLDAGDIDGMLALFDKNIVKEQIGFLTSEGQSLDAAKEQFLREAIIAPGVRGVSDLSQIEDISLDTSRIEPFGSGAFSLNGVAILKSGDVVSASILLDQDYQLTSAVG